MKTIVGIDNGVSGAIAILGDGVNHFFTAKEYTKKELSYTKTKQYITRIDTEKMKDILATILGLHYGDGVGWVGNRDVKVYLERPMVNPMRFKASASSLRALEATLIVLEELRLPYCYLDSKEWQKDLLPKGIKGTPNLKKASVDIARREFPRFKDCIRDGDALLIALHGKNKEAV